MRFCSPPLTNPKSAAFAAGIAVSQAAAAADKPEPGPNPKSLFVGVGHNGLRIVSENGTDWKNEQTGKEGEFYRAVSFGNGVFAAVGTFGGKNIFAATKDGVTWKSSSKDGKYVNYVRGLCFGKDFFLGIGGDPGGVGDSKPFVVQSTDGENWSEVQPIAGKNILRRVAWGNNLFVGVGDRGRRAASADGKDWKDAPNVKAIDTLVDVAFGKGVFAGVGLHSLRMLSQDGLTWSNRLVGEEGEHLNTIVWAGEQFVAVGMGATYTSPDGVTWKRQPNKDAPLTMIYGNGIFVGSNWKGRILKSADGVEWQQVHKCEQHIEAIGYG